MIPFDPGRRIKLRGPAAGGRSVVMVAKSVPASPRRNIVSNHSAFPAQSRDPQTIVAAANDHSGGYFPHTLEPAA
jgi:hypothetical protein